MCPRGLTLILFCQMHGLVVHVPVWSCHDALGPQKGTVHFLVFLLVPRFMVQKLHNGLILLSMWCSSAYRIWGIFRVSLIFAEFATSLKSPKIDTVKNKPNHTSSLRVLEIMKIGHSENLTHLPSVIFAKISRREKFPIYGMCVHVWIPRVPTKEQL